jgi:hypothetical protein
MMTSSSTGSSASILSPIVVMLTVTIAAASGGDSPLRAVDASLLDGLRFDCSAAYNQLRPVELVANYSESEDDSDVGSVASTIASPDVDACLVAHPGSDPGH